MGRLCTRTPPFIIRLLATMRPGWQFRSGLELQWELPGAEAGVGDPAGAATITYTSTTTTTSSKTQTGRTYQTGWGEATATGNTIRSTAEAHRIPTEAPRNSMVATPAEILCPTARIMPVEIRGRGEAGNKQV